MEILKPPRLQFVCKSCGALNEGKEEEFKDLNTSPPLFQATCGWCEMPLSVYIHALAAKIVGRM